MFYQPGQLITNRILYYNKAMCISRHACCRNGLIAIDTIKSIERFTKIVPSESIYMVMVIRNSDSAMLGSLDVAHIDSGA